MFIIPLLLVILVDYPLSLLALNKYKRLKKTLFVIGFLAATAIQAAEVAAIRSFKDFAFTLIFFPVFLNFFIMFIRDLGRWLKQVRNKAQNETEPVINAKKLEDVKKEEAIEDANRRKFLKILAGAGLGAVMLSLMNPKKVGAAFFGSIPGPGTIFIKDSGGTKIDPAIKSPTDSFGITNVDDSGDYPHYYGFEHYNGTEWYIIHEDSSGNYTYASTLNNALVNYSAAWVARTTTLTFGSYYQAF